MKSTAIFLAIACLLATVPTAHAADIPSSSITALKRDIAAESKSRGSVTSKRRAFKNIIRDAESLLRRSARADNRFEVHALILDIQKRILAIDNSDENRQELFDTCETLVKAPDRYAALRLEADLILMEKTMSGSNADIHARTEALESLLKRYRDTPGELKSLTIAYHIAPKLEAFELQQDLVDALRERFPAEPEAIQFRRQNNTGGVLDVVFAGSFKRTDGSTLTFPHDRMGSTSLLIFWSKEIPGIENRLKDVKLLQDAHPGQFDVFSFNLDELPDAGSQILKANGVNGEALHLPGGKSNPTFTTYVSQAPEALIVNAHGHALLETAPGLIGRMTLVPAITGQDNSGKKSDIRQTSQATPAGSFLDSPRYTAQMQSLFIGDFLIQNPGAAFQAAKPPEYLTGEDLSNARTPESVPEDVLASIQAGFTPPPERYRLSIKDALAGYTKVDQLCQAAIKAHSAAPDLWLVRNRRIIALQGMWLLSGDARHLDAAVTEANAILNSELPEEALVVAKFCLTQKALRDGESNSYSPVSKFIDAFGGCNAPGNALAVSTILALTDNNRELHFEHRKTLLEDYADNPVLWPVTSFLRDRRHRYRIFRATHSRYGFVRAERHSMYRDVSAVDEPADTNRFLRATFKSLDGKDVVFPQATGNKQTFVAVLEMPSDEVAGKAHDSLIKHMLAQADNHKGKRVKVMAVFLDGDAAAIKALAAKNEWTCDLAMVPENLKRIFAVQNGILSADQTPNIFLLRPSGSISWHLSGLTWPVQGQGERPTTPIRYGIEHNIRMLQMEEAMASLERDRYEEAIRLFTESIQPEKTKNDWWATMRHYGMARAHKELKQWEPALANIDIALEAHITFGQGNPLHCSLVAEMELFKADVLDQLNRSAEAEPLRKRAAMDTHTHNLSPYGIYTGDRSTHRLNPHQ